MLRQDPGVTEEGNFVGESVEMTLDSESMPEIIAALTDLYPDPEWASIREYATNARDSHIEAGIEDPIEILLPTELAPNFIVRDHGIGMSREDILLRYSKYGYSSKRESNDLTGVLGLGCKAGLTYTGQFTVRAVKDGWKTIATVSRHPKGGGKVEIMHHEYIGLPGDEDLNLGGRNGDSRGPEPNGVDVIIPRLRPGDFGWMKVNQLFQYWREGTVLIDGQPPSTIQGKWLGQNILLVTGERENYRDQADVVIMGGVPYKIPPKHKLFIPESLDYKKVVQVVCYIKMGSVAFTPSREDLHYTPETLNTLDKLRKEINGRIRWLIEKDLAEAADHWEALHRHYHWKQSYGFMIPDPKYKGDVIPNGFEVPEVRYYQRDRYSHRANYSYSFRDLSFAELMKYSGRDGEEPRIIMDVPFAEKTTWDKDNPTREITQSAKLKIRTWATVHGVTKAMLLVHPFKPEDQKWLTGLRVVPWQRVKDTKLPRAPKDPKPEGYFVPDKHGQDVLVATLPDTKLAYCGPENINSYAQLLVDLPGWTLVQVSERRMAKFLRFKPRALPFKLVYGTYLSGIERQLKSVDFERLLMSTQSLNFFAKLDENAILDPEIVRLIKLCKTKVDPNAKALLNTYHDGCRRIGRPMMFEDDSWDLRNPLEGVAQRYPLIRQADLDGYAFISRKDTGHTHQTLRAMMIQHVTQYLNIAFLNPYKLPTPTPKEEKKADG